MSLVMMSMYIRCAFLRELYRDILTQKRSQQCVDFEASVKENWKCVYLVLIYKFENVCVHVFVYMHM